MNREVLRARLREMQRSMETLRRRIRVELDDPATRCWWPSAPSTADCLRAELARLNEKFCDLARRGTT
jgi:hypothetical protein